MNASIITTFRCNARCHMCNIWRHPTEIENEISPEIIAKLPDGLGRINLTGGEPMMRDDIEELIGILYNKCAILEISTNGYYTDRLVSIARKFPRLMIRISLEGLPAINDRLRGTKNGFDHALRSILELKKTKVKNVGFSVVICDKNVSDLVNLYDLAVDLNIEFAQSTLHNSWYFHKDDNRNHDKEIVLREMERFIRGLLTSRRNSLRLKLKDWMRAYFNLSIYHYIKSGVSYQKSCAAGSDLFFLDPEGNITACNGSDRKWIMGNLRHQSFSEIWNSEQAENIRNLVKSCRKGCAFIGTARFDMRRNPIAPFAWIIKNKIYLIRKKPLDLNNTRNLDGVVSEAAKKEKKAECAV